MMYLDVDPMTGTPMVFNARIQFNLMLRNVDKFRLLNNTTDTLLPLFWIDEEVVMPDFMMVDLLSAHQLVSLVT